MPEFAPPLDEQIKATVADLARLDAKRERLLANLFGLLRSGHGQITYTRMGELLGGLHFSTVWRRVNNDANKPPWPASFAHLATRAGNRSESQP